MAVEKRIRALDALPAGYIKVSSGLGDVEPQAVLLVPTFSDGEVNGVIELGFLRRLEPRDSALLEMIAGNLGTALEAARYRQRLQVVLEETQQLNEELQVQQEELKTANEELEEQSRVLRESQAHLETQQAELEQTNEQLNEKTLRLQEQRFVQAKENVWNALYFLRSCAICLFSADAAEGQFTSSPASWRLAMKPTKPVTNNACSQRPSGVRGSSPRAEYLSPSLACASSNSPDSI